MDGLKTPGRISLCVLLCVLGFAGNWFRLPVFFSGDFLMGSFFVMLAILTLGGIHGGIVSFVAASSTYLFWNHPLAFIVFTCEGLFVAILYSRRKGNPVIYDILYWLCAGIPMIYFFYHHIMGMQIQGTLVIMLKQSVNGVFNCLLATLAFLLARFLVRPKRARIAYSQLLFVVMALLAVAPSLYLFVTEMRTYQEKRTETLESTVSYVAKASRKILADWIWENHKNIQFLSTLVGDPDTSTFDQMQHYVEMIRVLTPALKKAGVINKDAISVSYSPLEDDGKSTLGVDLSDRPHISVMRNEKKPYIPEVVMGKLAPSPIVLLLAPIVISGEYKGYCSGVVETSQISAILSNVAELGTNITVIDGYNKVIASTVPDLKTMDVLQRPYLRERETSDSGTVLWLPDPGPNTNITRQWREAFLFNSAPIANCSSWKLIVEAPCLPLTEDILRHSILRLTLLNILILCVVALSHFLSRWFISVIVNLQDLTRALPRRLDEIAHIRWPKSRIEELAALSENFQEMARALTEDMARRGVAEKALRLSEARFSTIFRASPVGIAITRIENGQYLDVNDAWLELTGLNRDDVIGRTSTEVDLWVVPTDREKLLAPLLEQNTVHEFELRLRHKSGHIHDILLSAELIELGGERCVLSLGQDITSIRQSEEELRESEARFRTLIEGAPEAIFVQCGGRFVYLNPAMVSMLGASEAEELIDREFMELIAPEYRGSVLDRIRQQRETGKAAPLMAQEYLRLDGSRIPVETTAVPIKYKGRVAHLVFVRDTTERKRSEEVLREREEIYSAIVDQAAEGIVLVDAETLSVVEFNNAACHGLGYSREEFARLLLLDMQDQATREGFAEHVRSIVKAGRAHFETRQRRKDGTIRDVMVSDRVICRRGRQYLAGIWQDITERKQLELEKGRAEAKLNQAHKMEALGTLAGGIAHDFNNILGIIFGYAEMARLDSDNPAQVREYTREVLKAAERARDLVKQILAFSRQGEQAKQPVQVGLVVKEVLKMLRASLPSTIQIQQNVESRATVMADPTQIHQVMMNLCTNSAQAMDGDVGVLRVSLTDVPPGPNCPPPHFELQPGRYVKLSVGDTGHGIDPSILNRIFDPFFTTKEQGIGTGLGLSVVHGIVKSHGGAIVVESLPGQGTAFHIFFPALEGEAEPSSELAAPLPRGDERILVVDDEPALAKTTQRVLEQLGYRVEFRTNGVDALEAIRRQSKETPFDMVITDMTMPHLTGADLARELFKLQPDIAVLICTGFSEKMDTEKARSLGIQGFLMKPVESKELATVVRAILDGRRARSGKSWK